MQRKVVLDVETTGLNPKSGHKIIEIGCVEVMDRVETGNIFHTYINPKRDIPSASIKIHGITNAKVANMPVFLEIADDFLHFIKNSELIIHNAKFDITFLNHEFRNIKYNQISFDNVIDTLFIAKNKFPGASATLDALCKRFNISLKDRKYHGALLDAQLLTRVYLELVREQQSSISFFAQSQYSNTTQRMLTPRKHSASSDEVQRHIKFLQKLKQ